MDWFALITLLYVVGFGSYGIPRPLGARCRRRFPVPAYAHCGFPGISGSRFRFHTITV